MQSFEPGPRRARDAAVLAALAAGFFAWVMTLRFTVAEPFEDYRFHNRVTAGLVAGDPLEVPHPLYHLLSAGLMALSGLAVRHAGMAVAVLAQASAAVVAWLDLRRVAGGRAWPAVAALGLALVAPLNVVASSPGESYFGYFFPNALHNPTIALLRPLALGLFLACAALLAGTSDPAPRRLALAAVLTVACALAKPSYVICLVPALAAAWLFAPDRGDRRFSRVALAVGAPAALLALAQAAFVLATDRMPPARLVMAPLAVVFVHMRDDPALLALKVALSAAFPLAVAAAFPREAARSPAVRLAWLGFAAGLFYALGLAEAGPRAVHGNFLWSGQVSLLVLFAASAKLVLSLAARGARPAAVALCAAVFLLHAASGAAHAVRFALDGPWYLREAPAPAPAPPEGGPAPSAE